MTRRLLTLMTLVLISACASGPVVDYDASANFKDYRRFAFISDNPLIVAEGTGPISPMLEGRIMRAIEETLSRKGYEKVAREDADFGVSFTVGSREKIRVDSYPEPFRGSWGWGVGYYGTHVGMGVGSRASVDVKQYTEGVLAIDIFDAEQRAPVWHSWDKKRITDKVSRNPEATIREVVEDILEGFPPGE